ncbi:MAG: hypothetical protein GXX96_04330 [Planctomycetaceae bacterium]|nr:hypothetical protein [Planctomycetaceae bacterium]
MARICLPSIQWIAAVFVAALGCAAALSDDALSPGQLRYAGKPDQTVGYRIEIIADRDDVTETLTGVVTYKFQSATESSLSLTYSGGLSKKSKAKSSGSNSRFGGLPFGPDMFPSRAFGPFSRTPFKGLVTTTKNELTLLPTGEIHSLEGDSQLPYLLGNASLLVFEPLPEKPEASWSVSLGVSITEEGGRRQFPYPRLPFEQDDTTRTAGSEIQTYQVRSIEGPLVTVDKTYRLDSPRVSDNSAGFEINGTGTWVFNRELGLSESLDLTQKLIVQKGDTTVSFPVTVKYNRMSDTELAAHQEEQKKKQEETKRQLAELQEKQANTPLTEQEMQKILDDLESDNVPRLLMALQKLQGKNPQKSDPRIAVAVDGLRNHENQLVKDLVDKAAEKWPLPEGVLSAAARKRNWSDSTGTFTVEAEFLELDGDTVRLRRTDGKELKVPMDRLSKEDQEAARELAKSPAPVVDNPFD